MSHFQDIVDFLIAHPPFNQLDPAALELIASRLQIVYVKAGQTINVNQDEPSLRVIRTGSIEVRSEEGVLLDRLSNGGCFGYGPLLTGDATSRRFTVLEDGLLYLIGKEDFVHLRHNHPHFDYFFARETRRRAAIQSTAISKDIDLDLNIEKIMQTDIAAVTPDQSILEAAQKMSQLRVSSLLVTEGKKLVGILTDRDLRSRVVAKSYDVSKPVSDVMTHSPVSLSPEDSLHQAYLAMMSRSIHHMPITDNGHAVGIITLSDLLRSRNSEPLFLIKAIHRAQNLNELQSLSKKFPELIEKLILAEVTAEEIGKIITLLTDALTNQLLTLGQAQFGPPPCAFVWLAFGSQGRKEQTLNSDQDNSFLLADGAQQSDINYFLELATYVCDGLNACGVQHCPGDIMAKNAQWCLPLADWKSKFFNWIDVPDPKAILNTSIFFDMRMVQGDATLFGHLQDSIFQYVKGKSFFLYFLLESALKNSPPLGFFKTFVLERDGNHNSVLDLKHRGTAPIVDLARLYCLSEGIKECNTQDRLRLLKQQKIVHPETADNLADAFKFISELRLDNQEKLLVDGKPASNNLDPKQISPLLRHQLKDAFAIVQECQQSAKIRFGRGAV